MGYYIHPWVGLNVIVSILVRRSAFLHCFPVVEKDKLGFACVGGALVGCCVLVRFVGFVSSCFVLFCFFLLFSGGRGKVNLELTTLARIFILVVCQTESIVFAIQLVFLACPSVPVIAI